MREVKFKAWDKKNKGFIAGFNMVNFHSYYNKGLEPHVYRYDVEWKLSDIELIQYTGLKDKNGKEIFESSIVKVGRHIHPITVNDFHGYRFMWGKDILTKSVGIDGEVIGNQYENPELLK
jgi:uncharacterized phage protein (TIGR01671 family)